MGFGVCFGGVWGLGLVLGVGVWGLGVWGFGVSRWTHALCSCGGRRGPQAVEMWRKHPDPIARK